MRHGAPFGHGVLVLSAAAVAACSPAAVQGDDPVRAEFIAACEGRREYSSMSPERRQAFCACGYDQTLSGLGYAEQRVARFYLLTQVGVDASQRGFVDRSNLGAIGTASAAIGRAMRQCQ